MHSLCRFTTDQNHSLQQIHFLLSAQTIKIISQKDSRAACDPGSRAETSSSQMTTEPRPNLTTQVEAESRGGKPLLAAH